MDLLKFKKMLKDKNKSVTIRFNDELLLLLNETIKEDKEMKSKNEFFHELFSFVIEIGVGKLL